uniref:Uncharacterized protein n=1 Tax=Octactis speculum TaxID=3111310 RepID=A0A6U3XJH3_9STRA|mmetsp:Transcript_56087/g.76510  ORF Transcript_56087/g.76510 Transcript_56087/m.76510 type:complete len:212 (+) Transcript_56087:1668-2303(+)
MNAYQGPQEGHVYEANIFGDMLEREWEHVNGEHPGYFGAIYALNYNAEQQKKDTVVLFPAHFERFEKRIPGFLRIVEEVTGVVRKANGGVNIPQPKVVSLVRQYFGSSAEFGNHKDHYIRGDGEDMNNTYDAVGICCVRMTGEPTGLWQCLSNGAEEPSNGEEGITCMYKTVGDVVTFNGGFWHRTVSKQTVEFTALKVVCFYEFEQSRNV